MRRILSLILALILICLTIPALADWQQDAQGWRYYDRHGDAVVLDWKRISRKWYWFDENGYMVTGPMTIGGTQYFFEASGAMATGWKEINGSWYYFDKKSGAMALNCWIGDYYLGADGVMLTSTVTPDGYSVDASGKWIRGSGSSKSGNTSGFVEEVVRLTNVFRAQHGLPALTMDSRLNQAAATRAAECKQLFEHRRPDGREFYSVAYEVGSDPNYGYGENLAMGYTTPQSVVDAWIASQTHRDNMLDASYRSIGVGCYEGRYWAQTFYAGQ